MTPVRLAFLLCTAINFASGPDLAAAPASVEPGQDGAVRVGFWSFDGDHRAAWSKMPGLSEDTGPRPPLFPEFQATNKSLRFDGSGDRIRVPDSPELRFSQSDSVTLEAWVDLHEIKNDQNVYVIGKGRTHRPGFSRINQNYGLRLRGRKGQAHVSFLFSTAESDGKREEFHRWTSKKGFFAGSGWHHIAVTYLFGKSDSIRCFIDGSESKGTWDLGGATSLPPVVDKDELWIGTSMDGNHANTFLGRIDEIAIFRGILDPSLLKKRFRIVPQSPSVHAAKIPEDKILVEIAEGIPGAKSWPAQMPPVSDGYHEDAFGFFQLPQKYNSKGIRVDRSNPFYMRAFARGVILPPGKLKILLRSRGAAKFWVGGSLVAQTNFQKPDADGHSPVPDPPLEIAPGVRFRGPGDHEQLVEYESKGGEQLVVLEKIVGGSRLRQELGESSVSWSADGTNYQLLAPVRQVQLTDHGWAGYRAERIEYYRKLDAERRAKSSHAETRAWAAKHDRAREFVQKEWPPVDLPEIRSTRMSNNAIDRFVLAKIERRNAAVSETKPSGTPTEGAIVFHRDIQPLLNKHCGKCHMGDKRKGGLSMSSRTLFLAGGKSGVPPVVVGDPAKSRAIHFVSSADEDEMMPPKGKRLAAPELNLLRSWIKEGLDWAEHDAAPVSVASVVDDLAFLRRVTLDTTGVIPSRGEIKAFLGDASAHKRRNVIDALLSDPRWADHWTSYWQDVLAENPNILKPSLNNTGPFRWWIYESFYDNKPIDHFVTDLVMMEGSVYGGGPGGFKLAKQNDVPMAAKAHVLGTAFLGVEMKCARCHDAPYHSSNQRDLFNIAAMLKGDPITVRKTSSVPAGFAGDRKPLITVTLKPGESVIPAWPFPELINGKTPGGWDPGKNSRARLAEILTSPQNDRFAKVIVNRLWKQFLGRGIVKLVDDWENATPSHPALLEFLARELVDNSYDLKHVSRLILNSQTYQRAIVASAPEVARELFASGTSRRMRAEQVVDSMFAAVGKSLDSEELNMDIDGGRPVDAMLNLGRPVRAWEFTSLSNERDRPALAMPRAQSVNDVLSAFGWRSSRPNPVSDRDATPNVLQPAILANGMLTRRVASLSDDSLLTKAALQAESTGALVDDLYLRWLTRLPTQPEREWFSAALADGFENRVLPESERPPKPPRTPERYVSWSNHLSAEATLIKQERERLVRQGDPSTNMLRPDWRERVEDLVWSLVNAPEFIFIP